VVIVAVGLFTAIFTRTGVVKILAGGVITGIGVAAMHYTGMLAMRVTGRITFDPVWVAASVGIAVVAATVALGFAAVVRGAPATVAASLIMAVAVCSMHYTGMLAVQVRLTGSGGRTHGLEAFELLAPIAIIAFVMILGLAYATVSSTPRAEVAPPPSRHSAPSTR